MLIGKFVVQFTDIGTGGIVTLRLRAVGVDEDSNSTGAATAQGAPSRDDEQSGDSEGRPDRCGTRDFGWRDYLGHR